MTDLFERLKSALAQRYAIEREIGSGGMATVYLAEDRRHGRPVAVKVLRPLSGNSPPTDDNGNRGYERRYLHVMIVVNSEGELVDYWPQHDQLFDVRGGPNEFNTVHAITISGEGLIYVSDRAHARIQVFDENGNFQFMFPTGQRGESLPYAIEILQDPTGEEFLWVADGSSNRMLKYDLQGNYVYGWGTPGDDYGHFNGPHSITTDQDGNLYIAEVFAGRVQKFVPRLGADPAKIAGQQLRDWD